jgi:hypothetical protein
MAGVVVVAIVMVAAVALAAVLIALVILVVVAILATMVPMVQTTVGMNNFFFTLSLSRTPVALLAVWHCLKKDTSGRGSPGTILFVTVNLNWCAFSCTRKTCSTFSCTVGNSNV